MCVKLPLYNLTDATVQSSERECIPHVKLLALVDCPLSSCLKVTSDWTNQCSCIQLIRSLAHDFNCVIRNGGSKVFCGMWHTVCPECVMFAALHINKHTDHGRDVCWCYFTMGTKSFRTSRNSTVESAWPPRPLWPRSQSVSSCTRLSVWSAAVFVRCCWVLFFFLCVFFFFCSVYLNSFFLLLYLYLLFIDSTVLIKWNVCLPEKKPVSLLR